MKDDKLPKDLVDELTEIVASDPRMRALREEHKNALIQMNFVKATSVMKKMEDRKDYLVNQLVAKYNRMDISMRESTKDMSNDDALLFRTYLEMLILTSCVIESAIQEFNAILVKYRKGEVMITFNDLRDCLGKLRKARQSVYKDSSDFYKENVSDFSDELEEKTKAIAMRLVKKMMAHNKKLMKDGKKVSKRKGASGDRDVTGGSSV